MECANLICLRWIAEKLPPNQLKADGCADDNAWFEQNFLPYLQRLSISQLLAFTEKELAISLEEFGSGLSKKHMAGLLNAIQLTYDEYDHLKISKHERWLAILSSFMVIGSSILGFSSGVIGIIALADTHIIAVMFGLIVFSFFPIVYLSKIGWEVLKKEERNALAQMKLSKLHWLTAKFVSQQIDNDLNNRVLDTQIKLSKIFTPAATAHILNEFNDQQQDAFCTATGLAQLASNMGTALQNLPDKFDYNQNVIQELRHLSGKLKHPIEALDQEDNYQKVSSVTGYNAGALDDPCSDNEKPALDVQLTVSQWYKKNKKALIKLVLPTFAGNTAGNFVFPGVVMMLGSKNAAIISALHLRSLAEAMRTSIGLSITISFVVALGITIAVLTLYANYKSYCRNQYLQDIQAKTIAEKKLISIKQRKSTILLEVSNMLTKSVIVRLSDKAPEDKTTDSMLEAEDDRAPKVIH